MTVNTAASSKFDTFWDTLSYAMNGLVFFFAGVSSLNFFIRSSEVGLLVAFTSARTSPSCAMISTIELQCFLGMKCLASETLLRLACIACFRLANQANACFPFFEGVSEQPLLKLILSSTMSSAHKTVQPDMQPCRALQNSCRLLWLPWSWHSHCLFVPILSLTGV